MPKANELSRATGTNLSPKRLIFVEQYLKTFNATESAARAGYKGTRYVLSQVGSQLLQDPRVREAVQAGIAERTMGKDEILSRLTDMARGDLGEFFVYDAQNDRLVLDLRAAKEAGKTHLVKSYTRGVSVERIEMYSAYEALVTLAKALGMFVEKIAPTDPSGENSFSLDAWKEMRAARLSKYARTGEEVVDVEREIEEIEGESGEEGEV